MDPTLEAKLAAVMQYLVASRFHQRPADEEGLDSYLNDPEIAEWVDRMEKQGRIKTTRFLRSRG